MKNPVEGNWRFLGVLKKNMQLVGVTEQDEDDKGRWKQAIYCGNP